MPGERVEVDLFLNASQALEALEQFKIRATSTINELRTQGAAGSFTSPGFAALGGEVGTIRGQVAASQAAGTIPASIGASLLADVKRIDASARLAMRAGYGPGGAEGKGTPLPGFTSLDSGLIVYSRETRKASLAANREATARARVAAGLDAQSSVIAQGTTAQELLTREAVVERIARMRNAAALDVAVRAELLASNPNLTRFQRYQLRSGRSFGVGGQSLNGEPPTLGQAITSTAFTTLRFAATGAALYGIARGVSSSIKEAQQLEIVMTRLETQLGSLDQAGDLPKLRKGIFNLARETGVATDKVAALTGQFIGAFGDVDASRSATEIAAKIGVIAQLDPAEIFNDLVAGVKGFADAPTPTAQLETLQQIGDIATKLGYTTGVPSKELIDFLGRVGPIAHTAGLSLQEAAAAGATLLQGSSVGGAALGEQFGRILTAFSTTGIEIARIVRDTPKLAELVDPEALRNADPSILFQLAAGFKELDFNTQRALVQDVGSKREGATLAAFLQNAATAVQSLSDAKEAGGTVDAEFEKRQKAVAFQLAQLKVAFQQLGIALFEAGLGDILRDLVDVLSIAAKPLEIILKLLNALPDSFVQVAAAAGILKLALGTNLLTGGAGGAGGGGLLGRLILPAGAVSGAFNGTAVQGAGLGGLLRTIGGGSALRGGLIAGGSLYVASQIADDGPARRPYGGLGAGLDKKGKADRKTALIQSLLDEGLIDDKFASTLTTLFENARGGGFKDRLKSSTGLGSDFVDRFGQIGALDDKEVEKFFLNGGKDFEDADQLGQQYIKAGAGHADLKEIAAKRKALREKFSAYLKGEVDQMGNIIQPPTEEENASVDVEEAVAKYESGEFSLGQFNKALDAEILLFKGQNSKEARKLLSEAVKKQNQINDAALKQANDLQGSYAELSGESSGQKVSRLRSLLAVTKDPKNRSEVAQQIASALKDQLQDLAKQADTAAEAARILRDGIPLDMATKTTLIEAALRQQGGVFQQFLATYTGLGIAITDGMITELSWILATGGDAIKRLSDFFNQQAQRLRDQFGSSPDAAERAAINRASHSGDAAKNALSELPTDLGTGVPNAVTDTQGAADAQEKADDERRKNLNDLARARLEYEKALIEGDPIKEAQILLREADLAMAEALQEKDPLVREAGRMRALAQRVRGEHALRDAMSDLAASQAELVTAIAEAAGDMVLVASVALYESVRVLNEAIAKGAGGSEINRLRADVTKRQADLRDAQLQEALDTQQFMLDMGQISTSQMIAFVQGLIDSGKYNEDQVRELQRTVKNLQGELGKDLQFNLPSTIDLPGLYEGRRLAQYGSGYGQTASTMVDNRTITISLSGVGDEQVVGKIVDELNRPPRYGIEPRIY